MSKTLGERITELRIEKNISQQQLAELVFVSRSTIANWETGRRVPDVIMLRRLADIFSVDIAFLLGDDDGDSAKPEVIVVDDEKPILSECMDVIEKVLPGTSIAGFTKQKEAIEYARSHNVALAFLDIEMGTPSGLDVCRELLKINPHTNVVFITAFKEYAFDAWETGASGFLLKPPTEDELKKQLEKLRHPIKGLF